jgi:hypothetical protein
MNKASTVAPARIKMRVKPGTAIRRGAEWVWRRREKSVGVCACARGGCGGCGSAHALRARLERPT